MYSALSSVKNLRLEVGNLFTIISEGVKEEHGEDGRDFIPEIQRMINLVHQRYRSLYSSVNITFYYLLWYHSTVNLFLILQGIGASCNQHSRFTSEFKSP